MRINRECHGCGLMLDRGEGFYLGPMVINYGIAAFGFVAPCIILWTAGVLHGMWAALLAVVACIALPIPLYRLSWSLWLSVYFFVLPDRLPANRGVEHDRRQQIRLRPDRRRLIDFRVGAL
jgi:hypothetical protein